MKKLLSTLGLMLALASISGCTLYFGPDDGDDENYYYSYCDDTGGWTCDGYGNCWEDPSACNTGGYCATDLDCAAGCYCDEFSGGCVETGWCASDLDCGEGYFCDSRSSCVPDEEPVFGCESDYDCAAGCYCDTASGGCIETPICSTDAECGDGFTCDEARSTCIPGEDPVVTCDALSDEDSCLGREDCDAVYYGNNCTDPTPVPGTTCTDAGNDCTCESYTFAACMSVPTTM